MLFGPTSVNDVKLPSALRLSLYPNPARDVVTVDLRLESREVVTFEISDMLGRVVQRGFFGERTAGRHTFTLHTSALKAGSYFIRLANGRTPPLLLHILS
jgi:hypothetical protein